MDETDRYQRARRRVRTIKGFYAHLIVYLIVNAGLLLINLFNQPGGWWFVWPLLGWGIAVVAHAVFAFGIGGWLGNDWEERQIRKIAEKETRL